MNLNFFFIDNIKINLTCKIKIGWIYKKKKKKKKKINAPYIYYIVLYIYNIYYFNNFNF